MEVQFIGKFDEVQRQANKWIEDHPGVKIIWRGGPIRVGHLDGEDIYEKTDWTLTVKYEAPIGGSQ